MNGLVAVTMAPGARKGARVEVLWQGHLAVSQPAFIALGESPRVTLCQVQPS